MSTRHSQKVLDSEALTNYQLINTFMPTRVTAERPSHAPPVGRSTNKLDTQSFALVHQQHHFSLSAVGQEPSFYEQRARLDELKRQWKLDNGRASLFDRRQQYKEKNERVKSASNATTARFAARAKNKTSAVKTADISVANIYT